MEGKEICGGEMFKLESDDGYGGFSTNVPSLYHDTRIEHSLPF